MPLLRRVAAWPFRAEATVQKPHAARDSCRRHGAAAVATGQKPHAATRRRSGMLRAIAALLGQAQTYPNREKTPLESAPGAALGRIGESVVSGRISESVHRLGGSRRINVARNLLRVRRGGIHSAGRSLGVRAAVAHPSRGPKCRLPDGRGRACEHAGCVIASSREHALPQDISIAFHLLRQRLAVEGEVGEMDLVTACRAIQPFITRSVMATMPKLQAAEFIPPEARRARGMSVTESHVSDHRTEQVPSQRTRNEFRATRGRCTDSPMRLRPCAPVLGRG